MGCYHVDNDYVDNDLQYYESINEMGYYHILNDDNAQYLCLSGIFFKRLYCLYL